MARPNPLAFVVSVDVFHLGGVAMFSVFSCRLTGRTILALIAAAVVITTMLAAIGAGPDEPAASATGGSWQTFEGHAFADSRIVPAGVHLLACLGGCAQGYVSLPVAVGSDGRYSGLKVAPGSVDHTTLPEGDIVTFWLVGQDRNVQAVQWSFYTGDRQTRQLHLSFSQLPVPVRSTSVVEHDTVTTDLTIPDADKLGLTPLHSPRGYINSWSYGGMPVLPALSIVAGVLLAAIGVSVLMHRRRLTW